MSPTTREQIEKQIIALGKNTAKSTNNPGASAIVTGQTITAHALVAILKELEKQNALLTQIENHLSSPTEHGFSA